MKKKNSIYSHLEETGVFTTGDAIAIGKAKQEYWKAYRRKWNKDKRQEGKAFTVLFSHKELKIVLENAGKVMMQPTRYIKQRALRTDDALFISPEVIGKVREVCMEQYRTIEGLLDNQNVNESLREQLLSQTSLIETAVLELLIGSKKENLSSF